MNIFTLRFSKTLLVWVALLSALLTIFTARVLAQDSATGSAGTGLEVTFPIEELGQCTDLADCMDYCEDPVNYNSCADYAKQKGFYKDDQTLYADDEFWKDAQNELGCNSAKSCLDFCSQEANHAKCDSWAKRNDIPGGYTDEPDKPEYLEIAKDVLGCDSASSCATACDDPANQQKCTDFANQVGLLGGTQTGGPGGCQTTQNCQAYCSDPNNTTECANFLPNPDDFTGPGGCTDQASCHTYCEQNPDECRSYTPGSNGVYVPISCGQNEVHGPGGVCVKIPDYKLAVYCVDGGGYWDGNSCVQQDSPLLPWGIETEVANAHFQPREEMGGCTTPGDCYDYCKANPNQCPQFDPNSPRPTDEYNPYLYYTPGTEVEFAPIESMGSCTSPASCYDYCSNNPGSCEGFTSDAPRPPEVYIPGTYYTPPTDTVYVTPSITSFYTTPIYYTPPEGSTYTTPQYYTPGMYSTPTYHTPPAGSNYTTPNYYTPWNDYATPTGEYPTPTYSTPTYYTPPIGTGYTTPYYYTPPTYTTPHYYTPTGNYTTPTYETPPPYTTPQYYTPYTGGNYTTPVYYTPPTYYTPHYYTPPEGSNYTTPSYHTPPTTYTSPYYYTPGTYPTPATYNTPAAYTSPTYYTPPEGSNYTSPTYYTPAQYGTPTYGTPSDSYTSPSYYGTPSGSYSYPTPSSYSYPSPTYGTPTYGTPESSYGTPSYGTPEYGTPSYGTPEYHTPEYHTPEYSYPAPVQGVQTCRWKLFGICF